MPKLESDADEDLLPINGAPPSLSNLPPGCALLPRCPKATEICRSQGFPAMRTAGQPGHLAACHLQ
jgi:oligopeptide/dipeptide ABC transporter ATP-binding protein